MDRRAGAAWLWRATVLLCLLSIGFTVLRLAVVNAQLDARPAAAMAAWRGHPDALVANALAEIGSAAASGHSPDPETIHLADLAAARAPLASEPFLVRGTQALSQGDPASAEPLLVEARRRDARAAATRVLLADLYLRSGRTQEGLFEVAALTRLVPGDPAPVVQAIAAYAREPAAKGAVLGLLEQRPDLRDPVLTMLASDASQAGQVLDLAGTSPRDGRWQAILIDALVRDEQFARARQVWAQLSGNPSPRDTLVNPAFARIDASPPFNWTLSETSGFAEPIGGGRLRLTALGRNAGALASQTLVLPQTRYGLKWRVGVATGAPAILEFVMKCLPDRREIFRVPLGPTSNGEVAINFAIPDDCPAQILELRANADGSGRRSELIISDLSLKRATS